MRHCDPNTRKAAECDPTGLALVLRYARQQREYGNPEPVIVRTIAEACTFINVGAPDFGPVPRLSR